MHGISDCDCLCNYCNLCVCTDQKTMFSGLRKVINFLASCEGGAVKKHTLGEGEL